MMIGCPASVGRANSWHIQQQEPRSPFGFVFNNKSSCVLRFERVGKFRLFIISFYSGFIRMDVILGKYVCVALKLLSVVVFSFTCSVFIGARLKSSVISRL